MQVGSECGYSSLTSPFLRRPTVQADLSFQRSVKYNPSVACTERKQKKKEKGQRERQVRGRWVSLHRLADACRLRLRLCSSLVPLYPWETSMGMWRLAKHTHAYATHKDHFSWTVSVLKPLASTKPISHFYQLSNFLLLPLFLMLKEQLQRPETQQTHTDAHTCTLLGN